MILSLDDPKWKNLDGGYPNNKMKILQKSLLQKIGLRLEAYGFKAKLGEQAFVRTFIGGRHSCHVSFVVHKNDFDVVADIAIRLDQLENMINDGNDELSKKRKTSAYSFGCELGNLVSGGQHRWSVSSQSEIDLVAESIVKNFVSNGFPYFEKYSDLENAFNLIAPHPEKPNFHSPFLDYRAKAAVGLALLLDKNQNLPLLIAEYEKQLEKIYPHAPTGFMDFVKKHVEN